MFFVGVHGWGNINKNKRSMPYKNKLHNFEPILKVAPKPMTIWRNLKTFYMKETAVSFTQ